MPSELLLDSPGWGAHSLAKDRDCHGASAHREDGGHSGPELQSQITESQVQIPTVLPTSYGQNPAAACVFTCSHLTIRILFKIHSTLRREVLLSAKKVMSDEWFSDFLRLCLALIQEVVGAPTPSVVCADCFKTHNRGSWPEWVDSELCSSWDPRAELSSGVPINYIHGGKKQSQAIPNSFPPVEAGNSAVQRVQCTEKKKGPR